MLQSALYLKRIKGAAMAKVKISDVAREAGVSLGTVSNALNHPPKAAPRDPQKLINETINRLGYLPNQSAPSARGRRHQVPLAWCSPSRSRLFSLQIASGAHKRGPQARLTTCSSPTPITTIFSRTITCATLWAPRCPASWFSPWHPLRLAPAMTKMPKADRPSGHPLLSPATT